MTIWIDAQRSPVLADWINRRYEHIEAEAVRTLDLRDAEDREIFREARNAASDTVKIAVMSKASDFLDLLDRHGTPPKIIWVTCGNTSNRRMRNILGQKLKSCSPSGKRGSARRNQRRVVRYVPCLTRQRLDPNHAHADQRAPRASRPRPSRR